MQLKVIGSSSKGNCYILAGQTESLLIECGVPGKAIKPALNFNLKNVVGCLLSHEHGDHCKGIRDVMDMGIDVWASAGTHIAAGTDKHHRARITYSMDQFTVGGFTIKAFDVRHDAAEPLGFMINHAECGNVLFITDTYYVPYKFPGMHNIIVEANYSDAIIAKQRAEGKLPQFLTDRIIRSHMSLETCIDLLRANDLSKVNNIVLIHLSDGNSDAKHFYQQALNATGKNIHVADAGLIIEFNKTPF